MCSESSSAIRLIGVEFTYRPRSMLILQVVFKARDIGLPVHKSIRVFGCHIHGATVNVLVVAIYRLGSETVNNAFFEDFE